MARKLVLLGPPSVGKGFVTKLLKRRYAHLHIEVIAIGNLVRNRFKTDEAFLEKFGPLVAQGYLIPDDEVCPMFDREYANVPGCDLLVIDGFVRNEAQAHMAWQRGLFGPDSYTAILSASRKTCRARDQHRSGSVHGIDRTEMKDTFGLRYGLFSKKLPNILRAQVIQDPHHIGAEGDIEHDVFPRFVKATESFLKSIVPLRKNAETTRAQDAPVTIKSAAAIDPIMIPASVPTTMPAGIRM